MGDFMIYFIVVYIGVIFIFRLLVDINMDMKKKYIRNKKMYIIINIIVYIIFFIFMFKTHPIK